MSRLPIAKGSTQYLGAMTDGVAVTPHASTTFGATRGIVCAVAGTAAVLFADSAADVSLQLTAGIVYPYSIIAVRITGTTATGIVALY